MHRFISNWDQLDWFDRFFFRYMAFFILVHLIILVIAIIITLTGIPRKRNVLENQLISLYGLVVGRSNFSGMVLDTWRRISTLWWTSFLHADDHHDSFYDTDEYPSQILPGLMPDWDLHLEDAAINFYLYLQSLKFSFEEGCELLVEIFFTDES